MDFDARVRAKQLFYDVINDELCYSVTNTKLYNRLPWILFVFFFFFFFVF